ncbi:MAG: hypothetical protein KJ718_04255 [Nanoarchaeota archaeon]|nr:hypothetical protein [Nanoarchaeota archaeon]
MNKQKAKQQIQKLVEKYQRVAEAGKIKSYNEAQTRNEFIEPLSLFRQPSIHFPDSYLTPTSKILT